MNNDQLIVVGVTGLFVMATFAPSVVLAPLATKACSTDQNILKWGGVLIGVLAAGCAVLYLEVLKLSL